MNQNESAILELDLSSLESVNGGFHLPHKLVHAAEQGATWAAGGAIAGIPGGPAGIAFGALGGGLAGTVSSFY
jgi:hypothetical protein